MIKKTITYVDYNGVERTEPFYFNLSEAEVMEWELSAAGGMSEMIQRIADAKDTPATIKLFKELVLKSYGEKSGDGKRFVKSEELSTAFSQTEAYSSLFMELALDDGAAVEFIKGVFPSNLGKRLEEKK